jgi:hypothetical protein
MNLNYPLRLVLHLQLALQLVLYHLVLVIPLALLDQDKPLVVLLG